MSNSGSFMLTEESLPDRGGYLGFGMVMTSQLDPKARKQLKAYLATLAGHWRQILACH